VGKVIVKAGESVEQWGSHKNGRDCAARFE